MNNYRIPNYYAVVDFECTAREVRKDWMFEIIEFPIVFVNTQTLKIEFTFHRYCRPIVNPTLTQFCIDLTGITQDQVDSADTLDVVLDEMVDFLKERNLIPICDEPPDDKFTYVWASDGVFDFHDFLFVECEKNKKIELPPIFERILDVRHNFRTYTKKSGNIPHMLEYFNLQFEGRQHSGIDDAKNIVRIMIALLGKYKKLFWETRWQGQARRDQQRKPRLGDWFCPDCNEINFATRNICFRCNIKRPANIKRVQRDSRDYKRRSKGRNSSSHNHNNSRDDDWMCPMCQFSNWASRDQCFKCKNLKPAQPPMPLQMTGMNSSTASSDAGGPQPGMMHPGMMNAMMMNPAMFQGAMNFMNPAMSPLGGAGFPHQQQQFNFGIPACPPPSPIPPNQNNGMQKSTSNEAESETSHDSAGGATPNETMTNSNNSSVDTQNAIYNPAFSHPGGGFYPPGSAMPGSPMSHGGMMMPFMMPNQMMNNGMGGFFNMPQQQQNITQPKVVKQMEDGLSYWICQTCNTHNFHNGSQCHGCGRSWICPNCRFNNYAFRNECLRCKTMKPHEPPANFVAQQQPISAPSTPQTVPDTDESNAV